MLRFRGVSLVSSIVFVVFPKEKEANRQEKEASRHLSARAHSEIGKRPAFS